MATDTGDFQVPEWGFTDQPNDHLSQKIFQNVPALRTNRKRRGNHIQIDERENGKKVRSPKKVVTFIRELGSVDDDKDDYLNALDPSERLNVLLRKLKDGSSGKGNGNAEENKKTQKYNDKMGWTKNQAADMVAEKGGWYKSKDTLYSEEEKKTVLANDPNVGPENIKSTNTIKMKKKRKKTNKQNSTGGHQTEMLLDTRDLPVLETEQDYELTHRKIENEPNADKTKESKHCGQTSVMPAEANSGSSPDCLKRKGTGRLKKSHLKVVVPKGTPQVVVFSCAKEDRKTIEPHASNFDASKQRVDFKSKLQKKLSGAQFRWINEQLYTTSSEKAFDMFSKDPSLFDVYHKGFQSQVQSWPQNPIDLIIEDLNKRSEQLVVADMGCGEAKIAKNVEQKVHSFDLVAHNKFITACDMSQVPLEDEAVDIAIYCLSLMGKNTVDFLIEANRILKIGGLLKIAEVVSRFSGIDKFIKSVCSFGFRIVSQDKSNKMFILLDFEKIKRTSSKILQEIHLKPCLYKKR